MRTHFDCQRQVFLLMCGDILECNIPPRESVSLAGVQSA
jgi:hypothetical protein